MFSIEVWDHLQKREIVEALFQAAATVRASSTHHERPTYSNVLPRVLAGSLAAVVIQIYNSPTVIKPEDDTDDSLFDRNRLLFAAPQLLSCSLNVWLEIRFSTGKQCIILCGKFP